MRYRSKGEGEPEYDDALGQRIGNRITPVNGRFCRGSFYEGGNFLHQLES